MNDRGTVVAIVAALGGIASLFWLYFRGGSSMPTIKPDKPAGSPLAKSTAPEGYVLVNGSTSAAAAAWKLPSVSYELARQIVHEAGKDGVFQDEPSRLCFAVARAYGQAGITMHASIIRGIVQIESGGDPKAERYESNVGDYSTGLMQIRTDTAHWLGMKLPDDQIRERLRDPLTNIALGAKYLAWQALRYKKHAETTETTSPRSTMEYAIAAYNSGSALHNFTTGRFVNESYVQKVLAATRIYRGLDS